MRIAAVQNSPVFGEVSENLERVSRQLDSVEAELVVLPELFATGYQFRTREELLSFSETRDGRTAEFLTSLARKRNMFIVAGFPEKSDDKVFNSAMVIDGNGCMGTYRKVHLFANETMFFDKGDRGFGVFDLGGVRVGVMICFDWLFPESARSLALKGAQVIAHPANLVLPYCQMAMVTRALENRVFTVTTNRIGREERMEGIPLEFTGMSRIISSKGEILSEGSIDAECVVTAEIEPEESNNKMITIFNHVHRDRRMDQYHLEEVIK